MAYKVLTVDYARMAALRDALREAADRSAALVQQMRDDVAGLASSWEGQNHDAFVSYFDERSRWLEYYGLRSSYGSQDFDPDNYLGYQAQWVGRAISRYQALEAEIDDHVRQELGAGS